MYPELSIQNTPGAVQSFRNEIARADAVLICTPEYIFSLPSGLKNAIEWCVSTTVFTDKPVGIITASAHGAKGHEELLLVMKTVGATITEEASLLIHGIRGKINEQGLITDEATAEALGRFTEAFKQLLCKNESTEQTTDSSVSS